MTRQLLIVRHAHADGIQIDTDDIDRVLSQDGCRDAMRMGKLLFDEGYRPDLVLSSNAVRAQETTQYMCEQLKFDLDKIKFSEDLYESSVRIMMSRLCEQSEEQNNVVLIGHNPAISYLGEFLTGDVVGNLPPGGVVAMKVEVDEWSMLAQDTCSLIKLYDPAFI